MVQLFTNICIGKSKGLKNSSLQFCTNERNLHAPKCQTLLRNLKQNMQYL